MLEIDRVRELFADARSLQADALELLARGDVRNAAEKAWEATRKATDALVLASGEEPERTPESAQGILLLQAKDDLVREARMVGRYYTRQGHLHGDCFYAGLCEPIEGTERRTRKPAGYIDDTKRLVFAGDDTTHRRQLESRELFWVMKEDPQ